MLASDLVGKFSGYKYIGKEKVLVTPEDVYVAASLAQTEILRDCKLLQDKTSVIFTASTEQHTRQSRTVSTISGTTTVTVTTTEIHGYKTGEEYVIRGVKGFTGANGRFTITVTGTATFTLNGATGSGTYTSGGTIYPVIHSLIDLVGGRMLSPDDVPLTKVDYAQVNQDREDFGSASESGSVHRIYQLETDPPILGLQGIPYVDTTVEVLFYRIPLPNEDVTSSVNPIVPDKHRRLMELATKCFIYEDLDSTNALAYSMDLRKFLEIEKAKTNKSLAKYRIRTNSQPTGMKW